MPRKSDKEVEIIIQYGNNTDNENKNVKSLQEITQKLFNLYIIKTIQNIKKCK